MTTINPLAIAVQGIGFGAAQMAAQGLLRTVQPSIAPMVGGVPMPVRRRGGGMRLGAPQRPGVWPNVPSIAPGLVPEPATTTAPAHQRTRAARQRRQIALLLH